MVCLTKPTKQDHGAAANEACEAWKIKTDSDYKQHLQKTNPDCVEASATKKNSGLLHCKWCAWSDQVLITSKKSSSQDETNSSKCQPEKGQAANPNSAITEGQKAWEVDSVWNRKKSRIIPACLKYIPKETRLGPVVRWAAADCTLEGKFACFGQQTQNKRAPRARPTPTKIEKQEQKKIIEQAAPRKAWQRSGTLVWLAQKGENSFHPKPT